MRLLKEENIKATFFITTKFALKYPELIREISKEHEVASHGYEHKHNYKEMKEEQAYAFIKKSKEETERIIKKEIYGFRAPRMSICKYEVLKKAGFKYDSSMHPTHIPGRYNNFFKPRKIYTENGMIIVPTSVVPIIRIPFAWYWFRNYGLGYAKICTTLSSKTSKYTSIYLHSWEFSNISGYDVDKDIKKNTGEELERRLREYIRWCKKRYEFVTMKELIKS